MSHIKLLVYADGVNLLVGNINGIKKNTEALIDTINEVGLDVNTEKTKYVHVDASSPEYRSKS
jgi:uncharacterized protein YoxC